MATYGTTKPQNPNSYIIFDFETGGLTSSPNNADVKNPTSAATEIALIGIKGDETLAELTRYQSLIHSSYGAVNNLIYNQKALSITGITLELLEDEGVSINDTVDGLIEAILKCNVYGDKGAGSRPVLVGHNVQFDVCFLQQIFELRFKHDKKTDGQTVLEGLLHGRRDHFGNFTPTYIDTWTLGKMWYGHLNELPNFKLETLIEKSGLELSDAHRAMNDVIATTEFFRACIKNMRSGYGVGDELESKKQVFKFPI